MLKRNRKRRSAGFLPVPIAAMLILICALSLCYLWLRGKCEALGEDLKGLEAEKSQLQRTLLSEESKWSQAKSPVELEKALRRQNLEMTWPGRDQIVRLSEPAAAYARFADAQPRSGQDGYRKVILND